MNIRIVSRMLLLALLMPLLHPVPSWAQWDKVFTQVADGVGADGTQFVTRFRITNLGPTTATEIKQLKILFFQQDGNPWTISTNLGRASEFPLDLGAYQTLDVNTTGTAPTLTSGYAIVRSAETATIYAEDYQVAITAFYEVRKGGAVVDTISVPASEPTLAFVVAAETDAASSLFSGFAIVNLSPGSNRVDMQLFRSSPSPSTPAIDGGTATVVLKPAEQKAGFLYPNVFPAAGTFKGMLVGRAAGPVAILALLQTPTATGVQYATMAPAYLDALRRNTYAYLRLGFALDADRCVADYWWDQSSILDPAYLPDVSLPWDLLFERRSGTVRRLVPQRGAQLATIGQRTGIQFDQDLTLTYLQNLSYSSDPIDLSEGSPNLRTDAAEGNFAFAIRTGLGRYVKVRVNHVFARDADKDLALEVFVYR